MRFSIIVPVYNVAKYLQECVDSILKQSYQDYELILVDDGSTDDSASICDEYAARDSRVQVIHKENGGLVSARKAAAKYVRGDYILSVDGDDFIGEEYIREISDMIDQSNADMVAWGYTRTDCYGKPIFTELNQATCGMYEGYDLEILRKKYLYDPDTSEINTGSLIYNIWNKAVRKNIYAAAQEEVTEEITEGEDVAVNWLILKQVQSVYVSNLDRYYYRMNAGSIMATVNMQMIKRQKNLEDFLLYNVENERQKRQVQGFSFYRVVFILDRAVKSGFSNYLRIMKEGKREGIYDQCMRVEIKNISKGNALRRFLIKNRCWLLLFLYHKARSKANQQ